MGALDDRPVPSPSQWVKGILEFSSSSSDATLKVRRRLVLRHAMANPDKGVIFELYRPELIDVSHPNLRIRGIEPTSLGSGAPCAMVQDWLVLIDG